MSLSSTIAAKSLGQAGTDVSLVKYCDPTVSSVGHDMHKTGLCLVLQTGVRSGDARLPRGWCPAASNAALATADRPELGLLT